MMFNSIWRSSDSLVSILLLVSTLLQVGTVSSFTPHSKKLVLVLAPSTHATVTASTRTRHPWRIPEVRGGSSALDLVDSKDEDEDEDEDEDVGESQGEEADEDESPKAEEEDDKDDEEVASPAVAAASIVFRTNLGNSLIDSSLELLVSRSRTVESVKQTLSRMLPGRPPFETLCLVADGMILQDDQVMDQVIDDDDESMVLLLDMIPPVEPKFAAQMGATMQDMTTSQLLDSYTANAAAMYHHVPTDDQKDDDWLLSTHLRQNAYEMRHQLVRNSVPSLDLLLQDDAPSKSGELGGVAGERRGQRYRSNSRGGARTNLKRIIQTNLNISWPDTIRNFLLFLFFGFFGGRNTISRNLLLLGAPMCFVLQARPVKILLKQSFYACSNPPGILLSLLPAPQQAILKFNESKSRTALYGEKLAPVSKKDDDSDDDDSDDDDE